MSNDKLTAEDLRPEYYEEEVDGGILRQPATRWRNDGPDVVRTEAYIDGPRMVPWRVWAKTADPKRVQWELDHVPTQTAVKMLPPKIMKIVIKPGEEKLLPSYLDSAIQTLECKETECRTRPFDCRNPEHFKAVAGGLAPSLTRIGPRITPTPPKLDARFDEHVTVADASTVDDRLIERARRGIQ
jgi:hypothetical protein